MFARAAAVGVAAAVLVSAPAAATVRGSVLVKPDSPMVGKRASIALLADVKARRLRLELVSPTGVKRFIWLRRAAPGVFRGGYSFADDGQWLLTARRGAIVRGIWVQQPPSATPPFKPGAKPSLSNILGQGTFVYP